MKLISKTTRTCRGVSFQLAILLLLAASWKLTPLRAAEPIALRAGPVTMVFDADNVFLRYVRIGPHEILRGINAPIRNQNWSTVAPKVSNLRVDSRGDSFDVTFDVQCQDADVDFRYMSGTSNQ
ncbi:MAG: hypothetical protein ABGX07_01440 [Pirellulaceae bacterium]|nr:hypothetical protein [Planctomycetota bacterium]